MKQWLPFLQWATLIFLAGTAIFNSLTDHGILMAINCFCIGFVFMGMLINKCIERMSAKMGEAIAYCSEATTFHEACAAKLQEALISGQIEVITIQPDNDHEKPNRLH